MCATTGLIHGGSSLGIDGRPFAPLDEREVTAELAEWWSNQRGTAKITGARAKNLNPIIRADAAGSRDLVFAWWWIWKNASGPVKFTAFNSRSDRLMQSWQREFQHRAIIPANWYIEKGVRFEHPTGETFGIAAVTSTVVIPGENGADHELTSYSLVTRDAIGEAASVHDRMPLVLPPDKHDEWLDPSVPGTRELALAAGSWSEGISLDMVPVASGKPGQAPAVEADPNALF